MTQKQTLTVIAAAMLAMAPAVDIKAETFMKGIGTPPSEKTVSTKGLKDVLGKYFLIGTAMNTGQAKGKSKKVNAIIDKHFNAVVAENCMKVESLQPKEGKFDFRDADRLVAYAKKHNLTMTGHVLVWHSQTPRWMFQDAEGKPCSREVLIERMKTHIRTVMNHFKGSVKGWDVVNEAIEDDGSYRRSPYYNIIGPEFIEIAMRTAMECDPNVELYLNDYSMAKPGKRDTYIRIIRDLKKKGIRIDAIGMQSHNGMDYPDLEEYEKSLEMFAAEGVKVMMTELDLNVLPSPEDFGGAEISQQFDYGDKLDPYKKGVPAEAQANIDARWVELFKIYHRHRDKISRITLWGVDDSQTWLNGFPVAGRTNYSLLFDRQQREKAVIQQIIDLFAK